MSLRERGLLLLAVFAVIILLWDFSTMQPLGERRENANTQLTDNLQQLASARGHDPDRALEQEREMLEGRIEALEVQLAERHGGVATPRQSVSVLAGLLAQRAGVDIIALENIEPGRLHNASGDPVPGLFVHRVRVVIESDFHGIRDYLERTAQLPRGVFWESLQLDVEQWPVNRIELMLYSVTLDDRWLGV